MKKLIFTLVLLGAGLFILSCKNQSNSSEKSEITDDNRKGDEYTSAYVCPMHCEGSGSAEAGKCPVCNMDYVANEDHKADGHIHEE